VRGGGLGRPRAGGWAEDEIKRAIAGHPEAASDLWHSLRLLMPTVASSGQGQGFVVRGHDRELLDRIAAGADPRLGTVAERSRS
jgi:hypothetical protein